MGEIGIAMQKFAKFIRRNVKAWLPYGFMVWWLKERYGVEIDQPFLHYRGLAKILRRAVKWSLPFCLVMRVRKDKRTDFVKILRRFAKSYLPLFFIRRWMLAKYGVKIAEPLAHYRGLRRLRRMAAFLSPVAFDRSAMERIRAFESKSEEDGLAFALVSEVEILCSRHTIFVAKLLRRSLKEVGIAAMIRTETPRRFREKLYFVVCPQMFERLPNHYVAFQMEQTVSSRWLTPEYRKRLDDAIAYFDYSLVNMEYWEQHGVPLLKRYYLPIDYLPGMNTPPGGYEYDVIFYGDPNVERRKAILSSLQQDFKVKILSEVYGDELYRELAKARIVVNIHYYENAMLETTRVYEVLSLGRSIVISETGCDKAEEERLKGIVDFVPLNDISALKDRVRYWLEDDARRTEVVSRNTRMLESRKNAFEFYFNRFLLAWDFIDFEKFCSLSGDYVDLVGDKFCISLPEIVARTKEFDRENRYGFSKVIGLRHRRGWTGCGLSYKFIMRKASELGMPRITVCEDDVGFHADYEQRLMSVEEYLKTAEHWDVFQGMMADIGEASVKNVERCGGETFVRLDHMISTVYNIYHKTIFERFAQWNHENDDHETNTIDRVLQRNNLDVITTSPFLVDHKEDLPSSLWDGNNGDLYGGLISRSMEKLDSLIAEFPKSGH